MAEPVYDYSDFLINDIEYDFLTLQDDPATPGYFRFSWQQGYYPDYYHYSRINIQDSIFTISGRATYKEKILQGGISLDIKDEHSLAFEHYNWEHKLGSGLTDLSLNNRIDLIRNSSNLLSLDSGVRYVLTNNEENSEKDFLRDYSLSGRLSYYNPNRAFSGIYNLPYQHNWERWQLGLLYYRIWDIQPHRGQDMLMLGGGFTYSDSDSQSLFPFFVIKYQLANRFIVRMKLQEVFSEYPLTDYFIGNRLLWRSTLPEDETFFTPVLTKKINLGSEFVTGPLVHSFDFDYLIGDKNFSYQWTYYDEEEFLYIIQPLNKKREEYRVSYALTVNDTGIDFTYQPGDRISFEPQITARFTQSINWNIFNEFLLSVTYIQDEKLPVSSIHDTIELEEARYFTSRLRYRYTKFKKLTLESGISYSDIDLRGSYLRAKPEMYIKLYYGKVNNESTYR